MPLKSHPKTHKSMHFALVSAIREIAVNTVLELTNILKDMKQTFSDYKYQLRKGISLDIVEDTEYRALVHLFYKCFFFLKKFIFNFSENPKYNLQVFFLKNVFLISVKIRNTIFISKIQSS